MQFNFKSRSSFQHVQEGKVVFRCYGGEQNILLLNKITTAKTEYYAQF